MEMSQPDPDDPSTDDDGPKSQPSNPPVTGPNSVPAQTNADKPPYYRTGTGVSKIVGVTVGFIAVVLTLYGFFNATAIKQERDDANYTPCIRSSSSFCDLNTYFETPFCARATRNGHFPKVCASVYKEMVIASMSLICLIWGITALVLTFLLVKRKYRLLMNKFITLEVVGHVLAAILLFVLSGFLIGYFEAICHEDLCGHENLKEVATDYVLNGPKPNSSDLIERKFILTTTTLQTKEHTTFSSSISFDRHNVHEISVNESNEIDMVLANLTKICPEKQKEKYYHWHFLFGGIFAIITGIVYIVIVVFSLKEQTFPEIATRTRSQLLRDWPGIIVTRTPVFIRNR